MNLFKRAAEIFQAKTNKLLDALEDPNASLDLSYEKMLTGLQETKRHLADVVAEQISLERQMKSAQDEMGKSEEDARLALKAGREDLARTALGQKQAASEKLTSLQAARDSVKQQADRLTQSQKKLEARIDEFRTQKEVLKSQYSAAQAQVRVNQSLTGIGGELGGVGETMQRAKDKTEHMISKAEAMESLSQSGALQDPLDNRTQAERELEALRSNAGVDAELEKLKQEMAGGKTSA